MQSWLGEWTLTKKLSWQKLVQIILFDDTITKNGHQDSPVLRLWRGGRKLCQGSSYSRCLRSLTHTNTSITLINHVIDQCTYSWHGDHEEIDAIPIGQCILSFSCICEVRGVATIFKLRESKLKTHTMTARSKHIRQKQERDAVKHFRRKKPN